MKPVTATGSTARVDARMRVRARQWFQWAVLWFVNAVRAVRSVVVKPDR